MQPPCNRHLSVVSGALCLVSLVFGVSYGDESERLNRLIDDIKSAPGTFHTSASLEHMARKSGMTSQPQMPDAIKKAQTALRATVSLGEMGRDAWPAIPVLVSKFPTAVHVVTVTDQYRSGEGSMEDWVMTQVMSEKNKFMFATPFLNYESISKCQQFLNVSHETDESSTTYGANRLEGASVTIHITFTFHAGACALTRITGRDFGTDQRRWNEWWMRNQSQAPSTAPDRKSVV